MYVAAWAGNLALLLCPWVWVEFHSEIVKADQSLRSHPKILTSLKSCAQYYVKPELHSGTFVCQSSCWTPHT